MKRTIGFLAATLAFSTVFAQNIPNSNFEDWGFTSTNVLEGWTVAGNVSGTDNSHSGSKAIRLDNDAVNETPGFVASGPFNGTELGKVAYDEQALSVRFWANYDLALGDQAQVAVLFYFKGNIIGTAGLYIEGSSADTFRRFSIPINWHVSTNPDSVAYVLSSKDLENDTYNGDGHVIIDDFHFATISTRNREVPNGDFENWMEEKHPHLNGWFTSDEFLLELTGLAPSPALVSESSDGRSGTKALELTSRQVGDDIIGGIAFTGKDISALERPGFAISDRWKYFEGYYKYNPVNGDTAFLGAVLFKNGQEIGGAELYITGSNSSYTYFAEEIQYGSADVPDSAFVFVASCNPDEPRGDGSSLILDDLKFSDWNASVFNLDVNKLRVYPNPFNDRIRITGPEQIYGATYEVVDVVGHTTHSGILRHNIELDFTHNLPGIYVLHLTGRHINSSKIIVKE